MKKTPLIVGVLLVVLVILGTRRAVTDYRNYERIKLRSDVHDPLRFALDDIAAAYDRGDAELAERKARELGRRWAEYLDGGGRTPELFVPAILELGPATRPAA